jgi:hypothetical protein
MPRKPRSVALPVILTLLVLAGLTLSVANKKQIRMQITISDAAGHPPVLHRERDYHLVAIVDDGGNPYRRMKSLNFNSFRLDGGRFHTFQSRLLKQHYDEELKRYDAMIRFDRYFQGPSAGPAFIELQGVDMSGDGHHFGHNEIPGSVILVWVD